MKGKFERGKRKRFAVIGLGVFGRTIALELARSGADVIAIDQDPELVEEIAEEVTFALAIDATEVRLLEMHGVHEVDAAVVAIGEHFEALVLVAAELLNLQVPRVIARAATRTQRRILERIGVHEIVSPEEDEGERLARRLLMPRLLEYLELSEEYAIMEVQATPSMVGKTLVELDLRRRFKVNVVTIRRPIRSPQAEEKAYKVLGVPDPETVIEEGDLLVVFADPADVERMLTALS